MPRAVVTYSAHARRRMEQRAISEEIVTTTLGKPTRTYLGSHGNMIAEKRFRNGRTVRVVYVDRPGERGAHVHVVTVMGKEE